LNFVDRLIVQADRALRTLAGASDLTAERPSPAIHQPQIEMTAEERRHAAGLMRVNHSGEVCARRFIRVRPLLPDCPMFGLRWKRPPLRRWITWSGVRSVLTS